uniref:PHD-type domain-containing protein n=1 Tax=Panagrolaimus davidi TaxID=227884 RepID=A0A914PK66_9BILA
MDDSPSKCLRKKPKIEYKESKLRKNIALQLASTSSHPYRKGYNCFCGKTNKSILTHCYGPKCPWEYVHLKCIGLESKPFQHAYCSKKCKEDEMALLLANKDDSKLQDYDWCSCRKQRGGAMVACDKKGCANEWYHLVCVGLTDVPKDKWTCPECIKKCEEKAAKRKPKKSSEVSAKDDIDIKLPTDIINPAAVNHETGDVDLSEGFCICKKEPDDTMIECKSPECPHTWFHLSCINLSAFPNPETYWCCSNQCYANLNEHLQNV